LDTIQKRPKYGKMDFFRKLERKKKAK